MTKKLKIEVINNIEEAKNIWNRLSPNNVICDDWNYRYCFYKYYNYPLHFFIGLDKEKIVGLFPLQFNEDKKYLEFFGGGFMRDNRVFIKPGYEEHIPRFYNCISIPAKMKSIIGNDLFTKSLELYKHKYIANFSDVKSPDDYLVKKFSKGSRYKVRKKIKLIELMDTKIIENNYKDIDLLIEINRKNFGEKSSFNKLCHLKAFRDLLKLNLDIYMLSFVINGKKEAVSFSIKYKDVYNYIQAGTNKSDIPNLGTYNIYKNFEKAIEIGSKYLDAGLGDLGWKERWHLGKTPQYAFTR